MSWFRFFKRRHRWEVNTRRHRGIMYLRRHPGLRGLLLLAALFSASCTCTEEIQKTIGPPVARARAAATVEAEGMVAGEPITEALKSWADSNAASWDELWQLVKAAQEN